jgi:hypothetical protein
MKKIIIVVFTLLTSANLFSQYEFAPVGAKWYYEYNGYQSNGYLLIESSRDTIINDSTCRILNRTLYENTGQQDIKVSKLQDEYIHQNGYKIYFLKYNKFYVLYDFSPQVGDTLKISSEQNPPHGCDSTGTIKIEQIDQININTKNLNRIKSSVVDGNLTYGLDIIENIGSLSSLFPVFINCAFDYPSYEPLRCYEDNNIGLFKNQFIDNCDYIYTSINKISNQIFEFYYIENGVYLKSYVTSNYLIIDIYGRVCKTGIILKDETISLTETLKLNSGFYFIKLYQNNKEIFLQKFIIQ